MGGYADRDVIRRMIDAGDIAVAYQPIVALEDRTVWGWEALLRGRTRPLGQIPPPVLVESASAADLLDAVTREVADQALDVAARAGAVAGRAVTLTLNLEDEQFQPDSELLSWLVERVDALGVPMVLELSERQPTVWTPERERLAEELARHGIGLGLDDLGAGVSRAEVLGRRAWDLVKLDRGLLLEDHRGRGPIVLRHAVALLDDYGFTGTLVEGIETAAHEQLALDLGIRYGQGNGLGPAADAAVLLALAEHGLTVPRLVPGVADPRR